MMTVATAPHAQMEIPTDSYGRVHLIGNINGRTGEFNPSEQGIPASCGQPFTPADMGLKIEISTKPFEPVSESPLASDAGSNTAVPSAQSAAPALVPISENMPEKKTRSYTNRVNIPRSFACAACNNAEHLRAICSACAGRGFFTLKVCVIVTLHDDRIELREKWGRQRASWTLEKLWDAAEGKLL